MCEEEEEEGMIGIVTQAALQRSKSEGHVYHVRLADARRV